MEPRPASLSRRSALKALGTAAGAVAFVPWLSDEGLLAYARIQATGAPPALLVLSPAQYATLEALVDTLIPADDRSPGAQEARVADYVDLLLSEAEDPVKLQWLGGLAALDEHARAHHARPYRELDPPAMEAVLTAISRNERSPETPLETFFVMAKAATVHGYVLSRREQRRSGCLGEQSGERRRNAVDIRRCFDGTTLVAKRFAHSVLGDAERPPPALFVTPARLAGAPLSLGPHGPAFPSSWSGDVILSVSAAVGGGTGSDIFAQREGTSQVERLPVNTTANESEGRLPPDTRWIAYTTDEVGREEVWAA